MGDRREATATAKAETGVVYICAVLIMTRFAVWLINLSVQSNDQTHGRDA